jgi:hypothetical protein
LNVGDGASFARPSLQALFTMPAGGGLIRLLGGSAWLGTGALLGRAGAAAHNKQWKNDAEETDDHVVSHRGFGVLLSPDRLKQAHSVETPRRMSSAVLYNLGLFLWLLWLAAKVVFP